MTPQEYAGKFVQWAQRNGVTATPYVGLQRDYDPVPGFEPGYVIEWTSPHGSKLQQNAAVYGFRWDDALDQEGFLREVFAIVGGGPILVGWEEFINPPKPATPEGAVSPIGALVAYATVAQYVAPERPLIKLDREYFLPTSNAVRDGMTATWQGHSYVAIRPTPWVVWMMRIS